MDKVGPTFLSFSFLDYSGSSLLLAEPPESGRDYGCWGQENRRDSTSGTLATTLLYHLIFNGFWIWSHSNPGFIIFFVTQGSMWSQRGKVWVLLPGSRLPMVPARLSFKILCPWGWGSSISLITFSTRKISKMARGYFPLSIHCCSSRSSFSQRQGPSDHLI